MAEAARTKNTTATTMSSRAAPATKVNALGSGDFDLPRINAETTAAMGAAAAAARPYRRSCGMSPLMRVSAAS